MCICVWRQHVRYEIVPSTELSTLRDYVTRYRERFPYSSEIARNLVRYEILLTTTVFVATCRRADRERFPDSSEIARNLVRYEV